MLRARPSHAVSEVDRDAEKWSHETRLPVPVDTDGTRPSRRSVLAVAHRPILQPRRFERDSLGEVEGLHATEVPADALHVGRSRSEFAGDDLVHTERRGEEGFPAVEVLDDAVDDAVDAAEIVDDGSESVASEGEWDRRDFVISEYSNIISKNEEALEEIEEYYNKSYESIPKGIWALMAGIVLTLGLFISGDAVVLVALTLASIPPDSEGLEPRFCCRRLHVVERI
ncbi:hypothetical protein GCM10027355_09370 [Haloplanus salinarum]